MANKKKPASKKANTKEALRKEAVKKSISRMLLMCIASITAFSLYFFGFGGYSLEDIPKEIDRLFGKADILRGDCSVHFIDVGQGDCTLIMADGQTILIDAGENDQGHVVADYLNKMGVKKIDLLMATHPHSDHIGGLDTIIDEFEIGQVVMPKLQDSIVPTTKTYKDVLTSISKKKLRITPSKPGLTFDIGKGKAVIIAPAMEFDDLNDTSMVVKFTYGKYSFLITGDIEKKAEKAIVESNEDIKVDVLKVAHHGSTTSSTAKFLNEVRPKYAVFSVGEDNDYGHPSPKILTAYKDIGAEIYRTDFSSNIIFGIKDGEMIVETTAK